MLGEEGREKGLGDWMGFEVFYLCFVIISGSLNFVKEWMGIKYFLKICGLSLFGFMICDTFRVGYGKFVKCGGR